jgi:predicted kinase
MIFDCIEFSDALAIIDVAYDVSFLLMDLEVRGFRALANRALSRYLGRQGDVDVLAALPLMLSLRACIRAKVAAMAARGTNDPADMTRKSAQARHLFAAAERFVAIAPPPCLVAVGGLSGSGKSTLARALAPRLGRAPGALLLRSDVIRKRMADVLSEERLSTAFYTPEYNRQVYETLMREASAALAADQCVVVDAVFAREEERQAVETSAAGSPFIGLWLDAPARALKDRVSQRMADASDATPDVVSRQLTLETGRITWHRVDASGPPEATLAAALFFVPLTE